MTTESGGGSRGYYKRLETRPRGKSGIDTYMEIWVDTLKDFRAYRKFYLRETEMTRICGDDEDAW